MLLHYRHPLSVINALLTSRRQLKNKGKYICFTSGIACEVTSYVNMLLSYVHIRLTSKSDWVFSVTAFLVFSLATRMVLHEVVVLRFIFDFEVLCVM